MPCFADVDGGTSKEPAVDRVAAQKVGPWDREVGSGDRPRHALVDGHGDPDVVEDSERVLGADVHRHVAIHGGRADQLKVRVKRREHQRDSVVGAGIDVQDQLLRHVRECTQRAARVR